MWELHLGCCVGALEYRLLRNWVGAVIWGNLVPWPWGWVGAWRNMVDGLGNDGV